MKFQSILSLKRDINDVVEDLVSRTECHNADLGMLFASHHYGPDYEALIAPLYNRLNVRNLVGCTGESIIGHDCEVEGQPAVALWLASMPKVRVIPFVIDQEDLHNFESKDAWIDRLAFAPEDNPHFVLLADPFSFDILTALNYMDNAYPDAQKVGGLASGAEARGQNRLFSNDQTLRHGLVGVALSGEIQIDTVVSQGCRPIGEPCVVTKGHANIIEELDGDDAYQVLKQLFMEAPEDIKDMMQRGVHIGSLIDESVLSNRAPRSGDFLVHNLIGVYEETKLAVNHLIKPGQTVQFQVRDSSTADHEMRQLLEDKHTECLSPPAGGLLFSCNGRGKRMFDYANHDIMLVNEVFENCQIAGFFAQGEVGPVGGKSFVHGFTSSLILFQEQATS